VSSVVSPRLRSLLLCLAVPCCVAVPLTAAPLPGDANCDDAVNSADVDALLPHLFHSQDEPCSGDDANGDGRVSAADVTALLTLLYPTLIGPQITFLGVASSDGRPTTPLGELPDGTIVYYRGARFGFQLVVEAAAGPSGAPAGTRVFNHSRDDPTRRPDFQIQVDRPLGDGSRAVCDESGVPAISPPSFGFTQAVSDALNDLACRFQVTTIANLACTQDAFGRTNYLNPSSRVQFCAAIGRLLEFASGDTVATVQLRDESGNLGYARRLMVRVGSGPMPPTFTPVPPTPTRTATWTRTASPIWTRTRTPSPTRTATRATAGPPSPTRTPTRTATGGVITPATRTPTRPPGPTSTPTRTGTRTPTPPPTATHTRTRTPSPTASPTSGVARGPQIVFFGVVRADDELAQPEPPVNPNDPNEIPVYRRPFGSGFSLVVEARPGLSGRPVGISAYNLGGCPDLQIQVTQPLGDPTDAVCDTQPPNPGGVPAINPPRLEPDAIACDRFNDLGCRFVNGDNAPVRRTCTDEQACVRFASGQFGCVASNATAQFCGFIDRNIQFPPGDTLVTARVRDSQGNLGPPARIIIRLNQ
jgi:hypothetical protein